MPSPTDNLKIYLLIHDPGSDMQVIIGAFSSPEKRAAGRRKATHEPRDFGTIDGEQVFVDPYLDCDLRDKDVTLDEYLQLPTST